MSLINGLAIYAAWGEYAGVIHPSTIMDCLTEDKSPGKLSWTAAAGHVQGKLNNLEKIFPCTAALLLMHAKLLTGITGFLIPVSVMLLWLLDNRNSRKNHKEFAG